MEARRMNLLSRQCRSTHVGNRSFVLFTLRYSAISGGTDVFCGGTLSPNC
jgi:hypothetical protein